MSIALDIFCLMLLLAIPTAVELLTCIGVGGWGWPISMSVVCMGTAAWPLRKRAPYSASAEDDMTLRKILHKTWTKLLRMGV